MMLWVIVNWTNIVWGSTLAMAYMGAKRYTSMTDEEHKELQSKLVKVRDFAPPTVTVVAIWLVLRCLYALGLLLLLELALVSCAASYMYRNESRRKSMQAYQAHLLLQDTEKLKTVLGNNLPEWLKNPNASSVRWLNAMIAGMWGSIALATESSIRSSVEPLLEANKPSIIHAIALKRCSIGKQPIVIDGIQHHLPSDKESVIDVTISWDSDMDIHLHVKIPGPDMHVYIRRFELGMKLRLVFSPHISQWPCFANTTISIMKIWVLNFDVSAAGMSLDAVPPVGEFLDNFIRKTLVSMLLHPKGLVIPIVQGYRVSQSRSDAALGTLRVRLLRVEDWHYRYVSKREKTPFYIKLEMVNDQKKKHLKSATYKGLKSDLSDVFSFVLYDMKSSLRFWIYFDVRGTDICVGECIVPLQTLFNNKLPEYSCALIKPLSSDVVPRARLIISTEFLRYNSKKTNGPIIVPRHAPSRSVSSAFLESKAAGCGSLDPPEVRSSREGSFISEAEHGGTLFVSVLRCVGLKNMEQIGTSDPYVQLRLRNQSRKSHHVGSTLNPTFNFDADLEVYDIAMDVLQVLIIDKNDIVKDRVMGKVNIPVSDISSAVSDLIGEWNLDPQGKVFLNLRILHH